MFFPSLLFAVSCAPLAFWWQECALAIFSGLHFAPFVLGFLWCCCCATCGEKHAGHTPICKDNVTEATITVTGWTDAFCSYCTVTYNGTFINPLVTSTNHFFCSGGESGDDPCLLVGGSPAYQWGIAATIRRGSDVGPSVNLTVDENIAIGSGSPDGLHFSKFLGNTGSGAGTGCLTCAGTYTLPLVPAGSRSTGGDFLCTYDDSDIEVIIS